jgi:collagen beta-1,O-galactosyltransferase
MICFYLEMRRLTCRFAMHLFFVLAIFSSIQFITVNGEEEDDHDYLQPTITIAILVRNKAHSLPWFFGHLENLNYPKNRLSLW